MNPWEPVFSGLVTVTAHATVEVKCRCGQTLPMHSAIPGSHSTVVCPNYACRREYRVESIAVLGRHSSAPCPESAPDRRECKKGGYQDSRCDHWQGCYRRREDYKVEAALSAEGGEA